ncbi:50S ribosomal protein L34e [Candidatus Thorarchaeota archaeon]|nr:MAG: 50S ribosomal protein L34e [Candidatus Thorarchaeota archaeon]
MPRPGMLTKGRANRKIKTPGGVITVHRKKFYKSSGTCAVTGKKMQLPREAKHGLNRKSSKSAKRPNRPYGGYMTSAAMKEGIKDTVRELEK